MYGLTDESFHQAAFIGTALGEDVINELYYRVSELTGSVTSAEMQVVLQEVWRDEVTQELSNQYSLRRTELKQITAVIEDEDGNPRWVFSLLDELVPTPAIGGVISGGPLPTFATANCFKKSGGPAETIYFPNPPVPSIPVEKVFRGRLALGPLGESQTDSPDGNTIIAANIALIQEAVDELLVQEITALEGSCTITLQIPSLVRNGATRTAAAGELTGAFQRAASFRVQEKCGTQNSRKAKNAN